MDCKDEVVDDWCDASHRQALVSLVFKVDENFLIDNNESYWKRFEGEMLPAIMQQCSNIDYVYVANYVDGSVFDYYRSLLLTTPFGNTRRSDPFSAAIYALRPSLGQKQVRWFYGESGRTAIRTFPDIGEDNTAKRELASAVSDSRLTSIARAKELLRLHGIQQKIKTPLHNAGDKIFENKLYAVFKSRYDELFDSGYENRFCVGAGSGAGNRVRLSVVFNVNADYVLSADDEYKKRFEEDILPRIAPLCDGLTQVFFQNFIEGVRLNSKGEEFSNDHPFVSDSPDVEVEMPLNAMEMVFDRDHNKWYFPSYDYQYWHEYVSALDTSSLAAFRKSVAETKNLTPAERGRLVDERRKEAERVRAEAKQADERRQAEIKRQEKLKRDRLNAQSVLALAKGGAPEKYSFSGYQLKEHLGNIYSGDFAPYMGGYESEAEYQSKMIRDTASMVQGFFRGDWDKMIASSLSEFSTSFDVESRRSLITMAFYAYHNVYREQCSANREMQWVMSSAGVFQHTITTKRGGVEVSRSTIERNGISRLVRVPFAETYNKTYPRVADYDNPNPDIPQAYVNDFGRLLKAEGCASPVVRQFEINLYLATNWLLPLQVLRDPEKPATKPQSEEAKPKSPIGKPKPRVKSRRPAGNG